MLVSHIGAISTRSLSLADVLLVPRLTLNLIYVGQLCELGFTVTFSDHGCIVQDPQTRKIIGNGRKVSRLFEVVFLEVPSMPVACYAATVPQAVWHSTLGHVSISRLHSLISNGVLGQVDVSQNNCQACQLAKFHALPLYNSDSIAKAPFDLIHSDIWGPSPNPTMGGSRYFVIFVDDFSRYTWIYLMKNRSELPQIYYSFAAMVSTHFSKKIKIFRSDNAQEYREKNFMKFLAENGTILYHSCPGTFQQNDRPERKHSHILEVVHALLIYACCPKSSGVRHLLLQSRLSSTSLLLLLSVSPLMSA